MQQTREALAVQDVGAISREGTYDPLNQGPTLEKPLNCCFLTLLPLSFPSPASFSLAPVDVCRHWFKRTHQEVIGEKKIRERGILFKEFKAQSCCMPAGQTSYPDNAGPFVNTL